MGGGLRGVPAVRCAMSSLTLVYSQITVGVAAQCGVGLVGGWAGDLPVVACQCLSSARVHSSNSDWVAGLVG
jgi:hypothetical protein